MKKLLYFISRLEAELSGWLLSVITVLLVFNVAVRYFGFFVPGLVELTTFVFLAVIYLGMAQGEIEDDHIKMSVIYQRVPKKLQCVLYFFNYVLTAIIAGVMTYGAYNSAISSYVTDETVAGVAPFPTFPVRTIIFFGLAMYFFQVIVHLYNFLKNKDKTIEKGVSSSVDI